MSMKKGANFKILFLCELIDNLNPLNLEVIDINLSKVNTILIKSDYD